MCVGHKGSFQTHIRPDCSSGAGDRAQPCSQPGSMECHIHTHVSFTFLGIIYFGFMDIGNTVYHASEDTRVQYCVNNVRHFLMYQKITSGLFM